MRARVPLAMLGRIVLTGATLVATTPAMPAVFAQEPAAEVLLDWQVSKFGSRITTADGVIRAEAGPRGWARARRGVTDLLLSVEFRILSPESSGAFLVRAWTNRTDTWPQTGYRIALSGDEARDVAFGDVRGLSGPVSVTVASRDRPKPVVGQWHRLTLRCEGDSLDVLLDGQHVQSVIGQEPDAGVVGIEINKGVIEFRQVTVVPLDTWIPAEVIRPDRLPEGLLPPRVRREVQPSYTRTAMQNKIQGTVDLEAIVGVDGKLSRIHVTRALDPGLDAEAIKAVERWEFTPAMLGGKPVAVLVELHMEFALH